MTRMVLCLGTGGQMESTMRQLKHPRNYLFTFAVKKYILVTRIDCQLHSANPGPVCWQQPLWRG